MSEHPYGPPMDPSSPLLRVEFHLVMGLRGFTVQDKSNVPLDVDWDHALADFVRWHEGTTLPPGEYVFTVHHGLGFRVAELPTEGLNEETRREIIDWIQSFCEETFRTLCVGLVSFPTPREIHQAARGILGASAQTAIRSLKDPGKLQGDFLTLVPAATNRLDSSRQIEQGGMIALVIQEGGVSLPGGMVAMPGTPDETGHMEVRVGYLPESPINDWLNAALAQRLTAAVESERVDVLAQIAAEFEDRCTWYENAVARIKVFVGL